MGKKKEKVEEDVSSGEEFGEEEDFDDFDDFDDFSAEEDDVDDETQEILDSKKYRSEDVDLVLKKICEYIATKDVSALPNTHEKLLTFLQSKEITKKREMVKEKLQSTTHLLFRLEILEQNPEEEEEEGEEETEEKESGFILHERKIKTKQYEMLLGAIPTDDAEALKNSAEKLASLKEEGALPQNDEELFDAIRPCCSITVVIPPDELISKMLIEEMVEYIEDEKFLDENPTEEELLAMDIRFNLNNIHSFGRKKNVDFKAVLFTFMLLSITLPLLLSQFV